MSIRSRKLGCIFFFKQKTAYDLRISDWSSDVCSSDLVYQEKASAASAERPKLKRAIGALDAGDVLMVTATDRLARNTRVLLNIQIGRASCRERVCQYV